MEPYIITGINTGIGLILSFGLGMSICVGIAGIASYYSRKTYLINAAIEGRKPLIRENLYKSPLDKMFGWGADLAEERYEAGKFDKLIASYKT